MSAQPAASTIEVSQEDKNTVPYKGKFSTLSPEERLAKARDKLERMATWKPEELKEYYAEWTPRELIDLWELLEPHLRSMCYRFGVMSSRARTSTQGIRLHRQIRRLWILQRFAREAEEALN